MLSKNELKYYSSLLNKKERQKENKFLVEGKKLIVEALRNGFECEIIVFTTKFDEENSPAQDKDFSKVIRLECIRLHDFEKLTDTKSPQEIVGVFSSHKKLLKCDDESLLVALENINDPGNLGSIIRSCDWFGVKQVILNNTCAEVFNPKVIRSSAGSIFHLEIKRENDFYAGLISLKESGYKIFCADLDGINIYRNNWKEKSVIVFANEANGPSDELINVCDSKITIPRLGNAESLNVSNACAIILSEATKN